VVMPDITRCGGISEMRKMANLAECYNVPIAPHNPNGPFSTIATNLGPGPRRARRASVPLA